MRRLLVLLTLLASVRAESETTTKARATAVRKIELLAGWCAEQSLFARLHDLYARLLVFEPDHARARRRLGYRRKRDGPWIRASTPKRAKDMNPDALAEYRRRLSAIAAVYADASFAELRAGDLDPEEAARIEGEILVLDPDHARIREWRNEVRFERGWEMRETVRARKRIVQLRAAAETARADAPRGRPAKLTAGEQALGVKFSGVMQSPRFRVASPGSFAELPELIAAANASYVLFAKAFGSDPPVTARLTLLVFSNERNFATALRQHPKVPDDIRRVGVTMSSVWVPSTETVLLHAHLPKLRRDLCARVAIDRWAYGTFGLDGRTGWAWEGLGLYLGYRITGERSKATARAFRGNQPRARPSPESKQWARMKGAGRNWFAMARRVHDAGDAPGLALLLHKDARTFRTRDILYSYALTAYLLESQSGKIARIMRRIGGGSSSTTVLEEELEMPLRVLELRLARWLAQRAALGDGRAP